MSRLPVAAFAALVAATIAAFVVTQHLKVSTPLIAGLPRPFPSSINPLNGKRCWVRTSTGRRELVSFKQMRISFYLLNRSDHVDVYMVDPGGAIVRTIASGRYLQGGAHPIRTLFTWDGREDDGQVAPDGRYYIRVALQQQGRTLDISNPAGQPEAVTIKTTPPHPVVTSVTPSSISAPSPVTIRYTGTEDLSGRLLLYRNDRRGRGRLVKSFATPANRAYALWDGLIRRQPAPSGTYLVGLKVTDRACNTGRFPAPGTTSRVAITVR
ncbi:MAG: FlgD immunoglobulin-like domain containing protein [Solirubrobacteraceae bacterium]